MTKKSIVQKTDMEANNLRINSSKVIKRTFAVTNKVNLTKTDVKQLITEIQNKYIDKNLTYMVSINTPFGFRSGRQFNGLEQPKFPDTYDWNDTNTFVVYAWKKQNVNVGDDKNNDCLFNSIVSIVNKFRLPKDIKTADVFKNKLGLKRDDKVPISLFSKAEDLLKININVDENYTSKHKYKLTANLQLEGTSHIKPKKHNEKNTSLISNLPFKYQKLVLCEERDNDVLCYEGGLSTYTISYEEYRSLKHNVFGEKCCINNPVLDKKIKYKNIQEKYDWFIKEVNLLKDLTNGKIDLSKSGYKVVNEAIKTIFYSLLPFQEPEPLTNQEQLWIYNSFMGGLIFCCEDTELENAYCYDKNSAYPSKMIDTKFQFPTKQGEFTHLDTLPNIIQFGIYRAIVNESDDANINKLFRFNPNNYYTSYDLTLAKELNLSIDLIQDDEANALLYIKDRAYGSQYFTQAITSLYEYKSKSKLAKEILNDIWGSLCSRYKIERTTINPVHLTDELIVEIIPMANGLDKVKYLKSGKYYKYDYARLGAFLTSAVRKEMALTILPYKDNVYRCHTDSILSDIELPLPLSSQLGEWKLEHQGKCVIHNVNNVDWNI